MSRVKKGGVFFYVARCPICSKEFVSLFDKQLYVNLKQHVMIAHKKDLDQVGFKYDMYRLEYDSRA